MLKTTNHSAYFILCCLSIFGVLSYLWFDFKDYPVIDNSYNLKMLSIFLGFGLFSGSIILTRLRQEGNLATGNYIVSSVLRYYFAYTLISMVFPKIYSEIFQSSYHTFDKKIIDLEPIEFIQSFYTYNPKYQIFMGWMQLIGALLLCFRRTYIVGALILIPILTLNLMHSYFFDIQNLSIAFIFLFTCVMIFLSKV